MKRIKGLFALIVILYAVLSNGSIAEASEYEMVVVPVGNRSVEAIPKTDAEMLLQEMTQSLNGEEVSLPQSVGISYEPFLYSESFDFYLNGTWVARADAECVVWHYTDGKVHLYQRTITVSRLTTYDATRTYGRIVNTDGSLSYTTGDRVCIIGYDNYWDFAIDFRVTPTEASFDCYEV